MGTLEQFPGVMPAPAVMHILGRFDRITLEAFLSVAIDLLDVMDGDADAEDDDRGGETVAMIDDPDFPPDDDGDDPDLEQTRDEDDWYAHDGTGAGCPVSDPGGAGEGEDDEEDDPSGQCDEDGMNTRSMSGVTFVADDLECGLTPDWGIDQTNCLPGATVAASDREASIPHRNRIRDAQCVPIERRYRDCHTNEVRTEVDGYRLILPPIAPTRRQLLKRKRGVPRHPRA